MKGKELTERFTGFNVHLGQNIVFSIGLFHKNI